MTTNRVVWSWSQTEKFLGVVDGGNLGGAVDLVHLVADHMEPVKTRVVLAAGTP